MNGFENFGVNFDDPDLRSICEQLESWLEGMHQDGHEPTDLIEVINTYSLFFGYTFADIEDFDNKVAKIREHVMETRDEALQRLIH